MPILSSNSKSSKCLIFFTANFTILHLQPKTNCCSSVFISCFIFRKNSLQIRQYCRLRIIWFRLNLFHVDSETFVHNFMYYIIIVLHLVYMNIEINLISYSLVGVFDDRFSSFYWLEKITELEVFVFKDVITES